MKRLVVRSAVAVSIVLAGCADPVSAPRVATQSMSFAKGGPAAYQNVNFTITDAAMDVVSDGKGTYRDGICGVVGKWGSDVLHMAMAEGTIPKSQRASCTGIAPRRATLTLSLKHVSDSPHVDQAVAPVAYDVGNIIFGFGSAAATVVNAAGSCGTIGLRFSPITYPGSSGTIRDDLGGGLWHLYTQPWPNNVAYCNNGTVTFWHVSLDMTAQIVP